MARKKLSPLRKVFSDVSKEDFCAVYLNWNRRRDSMTKLHWHVTRTIWRKRKFYAFISGLTWPLKAGMSALKMTWLYGPGIKERTGLSVTRQFFQQIAVAIGHFITPRAYYFYGLYETANRKRVNMYVQDHEIGALLKSANGVADYKVFADKRRFIALCERFGLPAIGIIAEFEGGRVKRWGGAGQLELPQSDLFAKPALGRCANGVLLYKFVSPGVYMDSSGSLTSDDEIIETLSKYSEKDPYILQKRLSNHPQIARLSPGALATSRVVTCCLPDGRCEDIVAIFKMATGVNFADNFSIGGIAISVDKSSGILGAARTRNLQSGKLDCHPDTGARIAGFCIPHWHQVIQLCLEAHAVFSDYAFVGWDVAVTEDGPVLVEGNLDWGVESLQRAHYSPLGETFFPEALLLHINSLKNPGNVFSPSFHIDGNEMAKNSEKYDIQETGYILKKRKEALK